MAAGGLAACVNTRDGSQVAAMLDATLDRVFNACVPARKCALESFTFQSRKKRLYFLIWFYGTGTVCCENKSPQDSRVNICLYCPISCKKTSAFCIPLIKHATLIAVYFAA